MLSFTSIRWICMHNSPSFQFAIADAFAVVVLSELGDRLAARGLTWPVVIPVAIATPPRLEWSAAAIKVHWVARLVAAVFAFSHHATRLMPRHFGGLRTLRAFNGFTADKRNVGVQSQPAV